eukprot:TRINITY_DN1667_c0_g2_i1.p1 TRINITY_DN1667_c0_g2~~TRINITY_DN1667_c0_g2_i1.p1  ORF type:complete len:142 (+),score=26.61 TRINITY_DN1667_c0_g2_i1:73-498(+)
MPQELGFLSIAERIAKERREKLQQEASKLFFDLIDQCEATHKLGRRTLTWGAILPVEFVGKEEDMDEVLGYFGEKVCRGGTFDKVEWCQASAPTQWVAEPVRCCANSAFYVNLRVQWSDQVVFSDLRPASDSPDAQEPVES